MVWVPKPGGTMRFGTQMIAACLVGMLCWVPKDYFLLLFSTRGSAGKRMDGESWVLKRAQEGDIVTQKMCGLSERLFVRCAWTLEFAIEESLGVLISGFLLWSSGLWTPSIKGSGDYGVQEWLFEADFEPFSLEKVDLYYILDARIA